MQNKKGLNMLDIVSNAIYQFYKEKDHRAFKMFCESPLNLWKELKSHIELHGFKLDEESDGIDPSRCWYISFIYKKGKFDVLYNTTLQVSKVAPLFHLGHCFLIENKDKNKVSPDLGECSDQPYTKRQAELHKKIVSVLNAKGYVELNSVDMYETVEGFKMPDDVTIFGHNVTVELLLFKDIYNILGDDE